MHRQVHPSSPTWRRAVAAVTLGLASAMAASAASAAERPRVGLVLGGGGARGAAHIGVLEVLEALKVPVDCVAGTSFGALVAGAWAAGVSAPEMRQAMADANWSDMFQDNPDYTELNYRYKRLLQGYLPGSESGLGPDGVSFPPGAVAGQKIKLFINQLVRADRGEPAMESLPLPVAMVATDIGTGERVVFRRGSLTAAMRASMSVPGLMAPAVVDGRKLVDGGLVDNLPIQEVRDLCHADVVIAVNVGSPLLLAADVGSLLTVSTQMVALLTEQNVTRSLQLLAPGDIYIKPVLDGIASSAFDRHEDAVAAGHAAASLVADVLQRLDVDDATWERWTRRRTGRNPLQPWVQAVEIDGLERADPAVVRRYISQAPDTPLDTSALNRDLLRAFGDGWYESVDYSLVTVRDRNILRVMPVEKSWGPDYLRLAINLESTLDQGSSYSVRAALHRTWLNPLGGELLVSGEIGSRTALGAQWYQPLDVAHRWFAQMDTDVSSSPRDLFIGSDRVASYRLYQGTAEVSAGVNWLLLGQLRAGYAFTAARAELDTGVDVLGPVGTIERDGPVLSLDLDQFNRLYFPTDGWALSARYFHSGDGSYSRASVDLRGAYSVGAWVLGARGAYVGSPRGELPLFDAGTLGGFLNLSAYGQDQIVADSIRYVQVRAERIIGHAPLGLRGDLRLGLALEGARRGLTYAGDDRDGTLDSVAVYLGGETLVGPVYIGLGVSSRGPSNAYLFLGTP